MIAEAKQSILNLGYRTVIGWLQRLYGYIISLFQGPKEEEVSLSRDAADERKELQALMSRDVVMRQGIIVIAIGAGMPVDIMFTGAEGTVLGYLLKPVWDILIKFPVR